MTSASASAEASEWTTQDTVLQSTFLALLVVDWGQRSTIAADSELREGNPVLGQAPSASEVDRYFIAVAILHTLTAYLLSPKAREQFQIFTLGIEGKTVSVNYGLGIKTKF